MGKDKKKKCEIGPSWFPMDFGRFVSFVMFVFGFRTKVVNVDGTKYKRKHTGGALIASNHATFYDPIIIMSCFNGHRIFSVVAEIATDKKFTGALIRGMKVIRVDREGFDIECISSVVSHLKEEKLVSIFPQGRLIWDGSMDEIKAGTVVMASQAKKPIIPMYFRKRKHWWQRQLVVMDKDFLVEDYCKKKFPSLNDLDELNNELLKRMQACKATYDRLQGED